MINSPPFASEALYAQAYEKARDHFGDFDLEFTQFSVRLDSVIEKHLGSLPPRQIFIDYFGRLHTNDLYLCAACSESSDPAWQHFYSMYKNYVGELARAYCPSLETAHDLAGGIFADLFLADQSGHSGIASYDGKHSLATWLRVIVMRRALNERERKWNHGEALDSHPAPLDPVGHQKIEAGLRANRYAVFVKGSLSGASQSLTDDERLLLLWRYEEGLRAAEIAKINGVHPSTITRRLQDVQKKLRREVVRILTDKYSLSAAAVEECISDLLENPNYSILTAVQAQ